MRLHRTVPILSVASLLTTAAYAQGVNTLVLEGDNIAGVGNVTKIDNISISNNGDYYVQVTTDNTNANANQAIIKNGSLFLREGQSLTAPAGSTIKSFDAMSLNSSGKGVLSMSLNGTSGTNNDSGLFWNDKLLIQEGYISTSPLLAPMSPYVSFANARVNDNNQILMIGAVDDPVLPTNSDMVIVVFNTDGAGNITGENVLHVEGEMIGSAPAPATLFSQVAHFYDFNNAGQVMFIVNMATGAGATDVAVYLDTNLLAEEGSASPIAGRTWSNLAASSMGLNNNGTWVMKGYLDASNADNQLIVKNNVKVVQKGDLLPSTGGFALETLGAGPVEIADNGDVLWYGDWSDPNTLQDTGLFVNLELKLQEGVTTIGSTTIKSFLGAADGYHISPNGKFIIFEAVLSDGKQGAFLLGTGEPGTPMCFGDGTASVFCPCGNLGGLGQGCQNSTGVGSILKGTGSSSVSAANTGFEASGMPPFYATLLISNSTQATGILGDGLTCVGTSMAKHGVVWINGGGVATWSAAQVNNVTWSAGQDTYFQAMYRDPAGPCSAQFNTTSAYKISFVP